MKLRSFEVLPLRGKKVLVRVDFNVPMKNGRVGDDTRIRAHLETLFLLKEAGAAMTLVSHLGRPKGKREDSLSLSPVAGSLRELTGWDVKFIDECIGEKVTSAVRAMRPGDIALLENIRFYPGEESNDPVFSEELAKPFDIFVMDAFSASHRAHASTEGVTAFLPSFAGKVMEKEVSILGSVRESPKKPLVLILGGAKVTDKIKIIRHMFEKSSYLLIGGAMAFPFLKASGFDIGMSFCEEGTEKTAFELLETAKKTGVEVLLPEDVVVSDSLKNASDSYAIKVEEIPNNMMGFDIGPLTIQAFSKVIEKANTVLWNGPLGVFETIPFGEGTRIIGEILCDRTSQGAVTVLGGGDTAAAANTLGFSSGISHISTGGGATLEFFEGRELPGITPLLLK